MKSDIDTTESDSLHRRARAFIDASMRGAPHEPFEVLASDIARFQMKHVAPVGRLARARGLSLDAPIELERIVAVPTEVFRFARVAAHPPSEDVAVFETSGTTSGARGQHPFRILATYDAGAMGWGGRYLLEERTDLAVISLTPPPAEAKASSLIHMIALFAERQEGPVTWHLAGGALDVEGLVRSTAACRANGQPVLLTGTAFAFVHLMDASPNADLSLTPGSRAMLTGGFKGRSREVPADELRFAIARAFGIEDRAIVGEYGMTELSSQLYETTLVCTQGRHGVYTCPPWVRVTAVDPETLAPVPSGAEGIARIVDLANVDSSVAIQTADRVRVTEEGVELLGRLPGATPRGCSLSVEEALG